MEMHVFADQIAKASPNLQGEIELRRTELGGLVLRLWGREQEPCSPLEKRHQPGPGGQIIPEEPREATGIDRLRLKRQEHRHGLGNNFSTSPQRKRPLDLG